jgi:hypothetical protein
VRRSIFSLATLNIAIGLVGILGSLVGVAAWWHGHRRRTATADQRMVMLKRVRNYWIDGVLEPSLNPMGNLRLDFVARPDMAVCTHMIRGGKREPERLQGSIVDAFDQAAGGLLVLGGPGSGKTTLLLELAKDLLDRAESDPDYPIPVVFNLSTWVGGQGFVDWMVERLRLDYDVPDAISRGWIEDCKLLPMLDSLDEVTAKYRGDCTNSINAFSRRYGPVRYVVCSRLSDYKPISRRLRIEQAIELQNLTPKQIDAYLIQAGTSLADVRAALRADKSLLDLLRSPLILNTVAVSYANRNAQALRRKGSLGQRRAWLFDAYIDRMFEHRSTATAEHQAKMVAWLAWLAQATQDENVNEFRIERVQPSWFFHDERSIRSFVTGSICLLDAAVRLPVFILMAGSLLGFTYALYSASLIGFLEGILLLQRAKKRGAVIASAEQLRWSWASIRSEAPIGDLGSLMNVLIFSVVAASALATWSHSARIAGVLVLSCLIGLLMRVLWLGWTPTLSENSSRPNDGIHRSARHAVFGGLALGSILGLTFEGLARAFDLYQAFGMKSGAALPGGILALGIAVGLQAGVTIAIRSGGDACAMHYALRARLAWARVAPFRLRKFLDESTDRLLLRRSGGAYRFTHRLMQEHFASMADELAAAGGRPKAQRKHNQAFAQRQVGRICPHWSSSLLSRALPPGPQSRTSILHPAVPGSRH